MSERNYRVSTPCKNIRILHSSFCIQNYINLYFDLIFMSNSLRIGPTLLRLEDAVFVHGGGRFSLSTYSKRDGELALKTIRSADDEGNLKLVASGVELRSYNGKLTDLVYCSDDGCDNVELTWEQFVGLGRPENISRVIEYKSI